MLDSIRSFFQRRMNLPSAGNGHGGQPAGPERPESPAETASSAEGPAGASPEGAGEATPTDEELRRVHIAACALLLELAHADEEFTRAEQDHIEAVLRRHFDLDEPTARELMELAEAERATAIDLYQFTSLIRASYDLGQKTLLAEVMWGLILSDGEIARHEAYLLRKIANLLDLKPGYLAAARKRAAARD